MEPIQVLICDDNADFRTGLRALLDTAADLVVVGEVAGGEEAVGAAARLQPDVVLMDLNMPGLNGVEATRQIVAKVPGTAVLVLTMYEDDATVYTAMKAGARAAWRLAFAGVDLLVACAVLLLLVGPMLDWRRTSTTAGSHLLLTMLAPTLPDRAITVPGRISRSAVATWSMSVVPRAARSPAGTRSMTAAGRASDRRRKSSRMRAAVRSPKR